MNLTLKIYKLYNRILLPQNKMAGSVQLWPWRIHLLLITEANVFACCRVELQLNVQ